MANERILFLLHDFDENGNPVDVKASTKRTIGQFVGEKSQKSGQRYPLDADGYTEIHGKSIAVEDNKTTPALTKFDGQHQGGAYSAFEEASKLVDGNKLIAIQNNTSNYGELEGVSLIKGKEQGTDIDGALTFSELLNDTHTQNGKVSQAVSNNLLKTSGFDNTNKIGDTAKTSPVPIQTKIGQYEKKQQRFELELDEYKKLGIKLMLEGSGEVFNITDPTNDAQRAAFLASSPLGFARLGVKVPYSNLNLNSIVKKTHKEYKKETVSAFTGNPGFVTGAPYNPMFLFDGFSNQAQTATCYLMFTALFTSMITIASTYEAFHERSEARNASKSSNSPDRNAARRFGIGRLFGQQPNQNGSGNFFGLIETKMDYTRCVRAGLKAFFGFGADGSVANSRLFINNPGYSNTMLRMIITDTLDVFGHSMLAGLIPGGIPSNAQAPSSVFEGLEQSSETLNKLRTSKLLKFMNIVAHLGDIILELNSRDVTVDLYFNQTDAVVLKTAQEIIASTDANIDSLNLRNAITNNKLAADNGGLLSWGNKTTPSLVTYTSVFAKARESLIGTTNPEINASFVEAMGNMSVPINGNKLSKEQVDKIEGQLGYSYLPFYFHDLRTNEIISFHGFLSDLSDGFSTDYESSEGYGRAGSIYHYKNVKRKTSLRFWMVATNKEDFDLMWYKLNKLIAMSQPMYTEGRNLSYTDNSKRYKFTQPLSQVPAATPIIRIRVGDIITNNASELDLARLYGYGNDELFQISEVDPAVATRTNDATALQNTLNTLSNKFIVGVELVPAMDLFVALPPRNGAAGKIFQTEAERNTFNRRNGFKIDNTKKITIVQVNQQEYGMKTVEVTIEGRAGTRFIVDGNVLQACFSFTPERILEQQGTRDAITTANSDIAAANANTRPLEDSGKIAFLRNSPVFKSFESSSGEGMLAVIDSIEPAFDMSSMVWEDEPGSVAPKAFEVAVSLLPMFDINPGIAADGQMIGAIYRVGKINHGMKALKYKGASSRSEQTSGDGTAASPGVPGGNTP